MNKNMSTIVKKYAVLAVLAAVLTALTGCEQPGEDPADPPEGSAKPIRSAEDLKKIGAEAGWDPAGKYILEADLTLESWTPIGGEANPFAGAFDGAGRTVTLKSFDSAAVSEKTYLGIFGYVKGTEAAKAEIKNLRIVSSVQAVSNKPSGQAVGLLAGYAKHAVLSGHWLSGNFTFQSIKNIYLGGLVGYAQRGAVLEACQSSMTMNIDGGNGGGLEPDMFYSLVGGFAGLFKDGVEIADCHNTGTVTSNSTAENSQVFCGGIAGGSYYAFTTAYQGSIQDCSNTGNISSSAKGFWSWTGGIAGCIVGDGDGTLENTTRILRCRSTGTITADAVTSASQWPYVGGIVGYNYYGALVSRCWFNGTVEAKSLKNTYAGGIAGYNSRYAGHNSRIEDCWSGGNVTGLINAGGIVGQNQIETYVRRCWSKAEIEVSGPAGAKGGAAQQGAGGIAGFNLSQETGAYYGDTNGAIHGCVALNPVIKSSGGFERLNRVVGDNGSEPGVGTGTATGGSLGRNLALGSMEVLIQGIPAAIDAKNAYGAMGETIQGLPNQSVYESLGWDFASVWEMGGDGYPALQWR